MEMSESVSALEYLERAVENALWWAEACLDPDDDCPAFRDALRAVLRDAITTCKLSPSSLDPKVASQIVSLLGSAYGASFVDIREANEHLQQLRTLLQAEIAKEGMKHDAQQAGAATSVGD
jgi:hypothetical protein